jgi:hypothetical protein
MENYLMQSTPKGHTYQEEEPITEEFKQLTQKTQLPSDDEFTESETRGSQHPSHQWEHNDQDDDDEGDPDYQPERDITTQAKEYGQWRTPQVSMAQEEAQERIQTAEEQLMAARNEEVQRIQMIDAIRNQNEQREEQRKRQEGIFEALERMKANKKEQEEEIQRLLKDKRAIDKKERQLKKQHRGCKNGKPNKDPKDPDDPSSSDSDNESDDDPGDDSDDESEDDRDGRTTRRHRIRRNHKPEDGRSLVKLPAPAKFNGYFPKVDDWIRDVDRYLNYYETNNKHSIMYTAMLLTGQAQSWWNHLEKTNQTPTKWKTMIEEIYQRFRPINEERAATERIYNLKQYAKVDDYISAFNDLVTRIPDITDAEAFRLFMRGLKPEIRNEMEKRYIKENLTRLQREAHSYDGLIQSQRFGHYNRPKQEMFQKKPPFKKSFQQIQTDSRPNIECFKCGKKGHMMKDCRSGQKPKWNSPKKSDRKEKAHTTYKEATKHLRKINKEETTKEEPTKEVNVIAIQ